MKKQALKKNFITRKWKDRSNWEKVLFVLVNIPTLAIPFLCNICNCNNEEAVITKDNINEIEQEDKKVSNSQ